ncbi:MAG: hypothetical protein LBU38_05885, partial [Propionibacteriaceae bacterium]|nr:hypothetical protein [Propionibacteriaceae bacterium]
GCANANAGWISVTADGNTVVWSVGGQSIANTYWADVSQGPAAPVVGSHQGRQIGESEVRVIERRNADGTPDYGDRTAWTKVNFFQADGVTPATGNAKLFSDKVNPNIMYGFAGTNFYLSTDGGKNFYAQTLASGSLPTGPNWNTSGHSQGSNKIQVDPFHTNSIYLAPNNAAAGLVKLSSTDGGATWNAVKVSPGTTSLFQQIGIGIGIGTNNVPALYAAGTIADNSQWSAAPAHWGVYRSLDDGATWKRINDDEHQYGDLRAISGDSRVFGRVYLGTGTRGTRVADVNWETQQGLVDKGYELSVTASKKILRVGEQLTLTANLADVWGGSTQDVTAGTTFTYSVSDIKIGSPTTFHPTVSYTYVVKGTYSLTDATGTHQLTSEPVTVEVANVDALVPVVSGTAAVGKTLTASVPAGWTASYTWLRDGKAIGRTGKTYVVGYADAGKKLSVRAVVTKGEVKETKVSGATAVSKVTPALSAKLSKTTVKTKAKAKVKVTVKAGTLQPTGKVTVKYKKSGTKEKSKTATYKTSNKGVITVTLPKLKKKGTYTLSISYAGNSQIAKSTTVTLKLKVKK